MASTPVCLLNDNLVLGFVHKEQQQECNEEKYTIHYTKCKRCLEHCARFVDVCRKRRASAESVRPKRHVEITVSGEIRAVGVRYAAKLIHARYKGSNEAKVDESHEIS